MRSCFSPGFPGAWSGRSRFLLPPSARSGNKRRGPAGCPPRRRIPGASRGGGAGDLPVRILRGTVRTGFAVRLRKRPARAALGGKYEYTEYALRYAGPCPTVPGRGLEIRRVGIESLEELVDLRSGAFGDSREEAEAFERATFASPDRQVYAAFLGGRMAGACSLGFQGRGGFHQRPRSSTGPSRQGLRPEPSGLDRPESWKRKVSA
ncbi:MAG: hypothetical protein M0C28_30515 [Candidatus Moduliflexus flocculans]|nr:hypothetical protein [Candidatus Moduliflexus flocculans]